MPPLRWLRGRLPRLSRFYRGVTRSVSTRMSSI